MPRTLFTNGALVLACTLLLALASATQAHAQAWSSAYPPDLTCGAPPCMLPNVTLSQDGYHHDSDVIVANPTAPNELVVAAKDYSCITTFVGLFSSSDAGSNWTHNCLPLQPNAEGFGEPVVGYDLNKVVYAGGAQNNSGYPDRIVISTSTNNGLQWSNPSTVLRRSNTEWLEVDTSPASPFKNSLYLSSIVFMGNSQYIAVSHSADAGKNWTTQLLHRTNGYGLLSGPGDLAISKDGTVYVTYTTCKYVSETGCNTGRMYLAKSIDGGNTWSVPSEIGRTRFGHLSGGTVFIYPSFVPVIAVDNSSLPSSGNVYLMTATYSGGIKVYVSRSRDGRVTWSKPISPTKSQVGDKFMHWISVAPDGTVGVTWLDGRQDGYHYQPYYAVSKDGGATWTGDQPLSSTLSDPQAVGDFGNFRTHTWAGNALYTTWLDTSTGQSQIVFGGVQF